MKNVLRIFAIALLGALLVSFAPARSAQAATINVGCDVTELIAAINTANGTPEADTLELAASCVYTLTTVNNNDVALGPNGLPIIVTDITLNGNAATIERSTAIDTPIFRYLAVNETGALTLNNLILQHGDLRSHHLEKAYGGAAVMLLKATPPSKTQCSNTIAFALMTLATMAARFSTGEQSL